MRGSIYNSELYQIYSHHQRYLLNYLQIHNALLLYKLKNEKKTRYPQIILDMNLFYAY